MSTSEALGSSGNLPFETCGTMQRGTNMSLEPSEHVLEAEGKIML